MTFEIYKRGQHHSIDTKPYVRIYNGTITFSKSCGDFLGASYALYLFDEEKKVAAIKPCEKSDGGYKIQRTKNGQIRLSARKFLEKIVPPQRVQIPAASMDGMIVFSYLVSQTHEETSLSPSPVNQRLAPSLMKSTP